jgi:hypothetical protein
VRAATAEGVVSEKPRISVIIPAWNEAESLPELHRELVTALDALGRSWEILYVDDGSRDGTDDAIAKLAVDPRVRGLSPRRNFGKSAAPRATRLARRMGGDARCGSQDDPAELPRLAAMLGRANLVSGCIKTARTDFEDGAVTVLQRRNLHGGGAQASDFNCGFALPARGHRDDRVYGELHCSSPRSRTGGISRRRDRGSPPRAQARQEQVPARRDS